MRPATRVLLHIQNRTSIVAVQALSQSVTIDAEFRCSIKQRREIDNRLGLIVADHMRVAVGYWSPRNEGCGMAISPFTQLVVVNLLIEHRIDLSSQVGIDDGV